MKSGWNTPGQVSIRKVAMWVACPKLTPDRRPSGLPAVQWLAMWSWILLVAAGGCDRAESATPPKADPPARVKVVRPRWGDLTRSIVLPAVVRPYQQATLYAKVTGYLKTITVDQGDHVTNGCLLADIEVPELLADQTKYQAEVTMTEADYRRLEAAHQQAPDLVTQQAVDKARGSYEMAKANLKRVETLLRYAKITAPFDGVITRRFVDPGAFIPAATSGNPSQSAALLTITDFSHVRIRAAVPEPEVPRTTNGLAVKVTVAELPGRTFFGTVSRYAEALDEATRTMPLEIDLPNPQGQLRPGMYARIEIVIERKPHALEIPMAAVMLEDSQASVLTVLDGKTKKIPVTLGLKEGAMVEVLAGLSGDDEWVLVDRPTLGEGVPVAVEEVR